jgi:ketosteroid isomerase-like protein
MMKFITASTAAAALMLGLGACDVEQTREAKLPEVDVRGGQAPAYDVDTADVDVRSERREVTVPDVDVDVKTEKREVTVPNVDVTPPDAGRD